jgi:hypothetical protein
LLLDRETRICAAGPARAVQQALRTGNPAPEAPAWTGLAGAEPLPVLPAEDWQALVEGFQDMQVDVSMAEIEQRLADHARVLEAMQAWLDAQVQ